jgi:hypothetical protein
MSDGLEGRGCERARDFSSSRRRRSTSACARAAAAAQPLSLSTLHPSLCRFSHRSTPHTPLPPHAGGEPRKTLKREEEPEQYWQSKIERSGKSPLSDPAAIIGILAIFTPFVILGIAIATGVVDVSAGRL